MDTKLTVNSHDYLLTRQLPQGNTRGRTVGGYPWVLDTSYQDTKEKSAKVVRTLRKLSVSIPITVNGVTTVRDVAFSFVCSRPVDVPADNSTLISAFAEIQAWIASEGFLAQVTNNEI